MGAPLRSTHERTSDMTEQTTKLQDDIQTLYADLRDMENRMAMIWSQVEETAGMLRYEQLQRALNATDDEQRSEIKSVGNVVRDMENAKAEAKAAFDAIKTCRSRLSELSCHTFSLD